VLTALVVIRPAAACEVGIVTSHLRCSVRFEIKGFMKGCVGLAGTKGTNVLEDMVGGSAGKCSVWKPRSMWDVGGTGTGPCFVAGFCIRP